MKRLLFRNSTYVRVRIYTFSHGVLDLDRTRVSGVLGVQFRKGLGELGGSISLEVKPSFRRELLAAVEDGDWLRIDVRKNDVDYTLAVGRVGEFDISVNAGPRGAAQASVALAAQDSEGVLTQIPVYFNPYDPLNDNALGIQMLKITDGTVTGSADVIVTRLIRGMLGSEGISGGQIELPPGLGAAASISWLEALDMETAVQTDLRGRVYAPEILTPQGNPALGAFLDAWRNPLLNELWVDTRPDPDDYPRFYLHLRERPFVNAAQGTDSPWFRLTTWDIDARRIENISLRRGLNRVNHFSLMGEIAPVFGRDAYAYYPPVVDKDDVKRYGLYRLEQSTRYFEDGSSSDLAAATPEWQTLCLSWNVLNHRYWAGTIDLAELRPEIRVGQRIRLTNGPAPGLEGMPEAFPADRGDPDKALTFYVEGVNHAWTDGEAPTARTALLVSRGYVDGRRAPDILERVGRFTGLDVAGQSANTGRLAPDTRVPSSQGGGPMEDPR